MKCSAQFLLLVFCFRQIQMEEHHLLKVKFSLCEVLLYFRCHVMLIQAYFQDQIQTQWDIFNSEVCMKWLHSVVSWGASCQLLDVCLKVCFCQLGGHFLQTGQSRHWQLREEGGWQWAVEVQLLLVTRDHTTRQHTPSLSIFFSIFSSHLKWKQKIKSGIRFSYSECIAGW